MTKFHRDSLRFRVMNYIFYCGIIPNRTFNLIGNDKESLLKMIRRMKKDNWVKEESEGIFKFITSTSYFSRYEEYEDYFFGDYKYWHERIKQTNYRLDNAASSKRKLQRLHKIAESSIFVNESGIKTIPENKMPISMKTLYCFEPTFYNAIEIKDQMNSEEARAASSRSTGIICWQSNGAVVFSLTDDTIKIGEITEKMYIERVNRLMKEKIINFSLTEAYLFTWKYERIHEKLNLSKGYESFFYLDDAYQHFYLLPYSKEGKKVLKLLYSVHAKEELMNMLIRNAWRLDEGKREIEVDGIDEEDVYLFNYLIPDIYRFKKFIDAAKRLPSKHFHVFCYDFQEEAIKREITENITYSTYAVEVVENMYIKRKERREKYEHN